MKNPQTDDSYNSSKKFFMTDLKVIVFGGKRWLLTAGLIVSAVMFMNWDSLVSIGAASIILAIAPCQKKHRYIFLRVMAGVYGPFVTGRRTQKSHHVQTIALWLL